MNKITPISYLNFTGTKHSAVKTATKYIYGGSFPHEMYPQTPKMQEIIGKIFKYFEEQGAKAEEAMAAFQKKFPNFFVQMNKNPLSHGKHSELHTVRESIYEKNARKFVKTKDIDMYQLSQKGPYGFSDFTCYVSTPESGLNLYTVPNLFNKTKPNGKPTEATAKKVEDTLQLVLEDLK